MHVYIVIASAQNCVNYYPQVASQNGNATFGLVLINFDSLLFFSGYIEWGGALERPRNIWFEQGRVVSEMLFETHLKHNACNCDWFHLE